MATIALVGDSHAQALWPLVEKALAGTGYEVVLKEANAGWSENSYRTRKPTLPTTLSAARPDVVLFALGGNAQPSRGESAYRSDVEWLVDAARSAGAGRILWFGPATSDASIAPDTASRHEQVAALQSRILPALGVEWTDSRPFTTSGHRSDGVHFTSSAYADWASQITDRILASTSLSLGGLQVPKTALIAGAVAVASLLVVLTLRVRGRL